MKTTIEPSKEQMEVIVETNNIVVTAKPGSGKTFTIVEKIKCISENLLDYQGVIAISFTRKASSELAARCKKRNVIKKQSFLGTIDNFYISQIICPFAKHITSSNVRLQVREKLSDYPQYNELKNIRTEVSGDLKELLIDSLREGHIFLEISGQTALFILESAKDCIKYLKSKYTHIFIDEYQDCGEVQHKIFLRLVEEGLVGIAVGDLDQAIYAFSERYSKYLASLMIDCRFTHYEITKNHRCHKSISNYSLRLLNHTISNDEKDIRVFKVKVRGNDEHIMNVIDKLLPQIKEKYNVKNNNEIAILCRSNNTATRAHDFLTTSSKLFKTTELDENNSYWARVFSDILESYFDPNVFAVSFTEKYVDDEINSKQFIMALEIIKSIFNLETEELKNNITLFVNFARLIYPEFEDCDVLTILKRTLNDTEKLLCYKPAAENEVCIMTLHKSKGLEFKVVFHLDLYRWIFPYEYSGITEEDIIQSLNLHYVGITRAIEVCYMMQGTRRYAEKKERFVDTEESNFLHRNNLGDFRCDVDWRA
ncbi:ATP-dependent helicase [Clostridium sp.]|uniref:ATP-dependent helicase n=1 Tax=Clostridium sp. TaxID=1506 RepID=UPI002FC81C03